MSSSTSSSSTSSPAVTSPPAPTVNPSTWVSNLPPNSPASGSSATSSSTPPTPPPHTASTSPASTPSSTLTSPTASTPIITPVGDFSLKGLTTSGLVVLGFVTLWLASAFLGFVMSLFCFGFSGSFAEKVLGLLLALLLGPFYFIYYFSDGEYCRRMPPTF